MEVVVEVEVVDVMVDMEEVRIDGGSGGCKGVKCKYGS